LSKRTTIKDIAKKVGVSTAAVTYVLNDTPKVGKEVRDLVLKTIAEMGYRQNKTAQALSRKPLNIGIVIAEQPAEYYGYITAGMENELRGLIDYKFSAIFRTFKDMTSREEVRDILEELYETDIKGLLFVPGFDYSAFQDTLKKFVKKGIPILYVVSHVPGAKGIGCVTMNGKMAGRMAAQFLGFCLGSKKAVAVLAGNKKSKLHIESIKGFEEESKKNKLILKGIYETKIDKKIAYNITKFLLDTIPDLKGIYVSTYDSVSVCKCIEDYNKKGQIIVIGHDLYPKLVAKLNNGSLKATLFQDLEEQGRKAVQSMYSYLTEGGKPIGDVLITPNMVFSSNVEGFNYKLYSRNSN